MDFLGTHEKFREEFEALCEKYGYPFWWYVVGENESAEFMNARGAHGEINEGILEYNEQMLDEAREYLEENPLI